MIVNFQIITYFILLALSMLAGVWVIPLAFRLWRRVGRETDLEEFYAREKQIYLVTTVFALLLWVRLLMIPLWFWALQSLIPSIPGAMCLTGVHALCPGSSIAATAFKYLLPLIYGYFLLLHRLDGKIETQPFTRTKLGMVLPVGLLLFAEGWFDFRTLVAVKPRVVNCCTSIFDLPRSVALKTVNESGAQYLYIFLILALILGWVSLGLKRRQGVSQTRGNDISNSSERPKPAVSGCQSARLRAIGILILGTSVLFFLTLALHSRIAPLFLKLPYHHCIFCLWQKSWAALLMSGLIISGVWVLTASSLALENARSNSEAGIMKNLHPFLNLGILLLLLGIGIMLIGYGVSIV